MRTLLLHALLIVSTYAGVFWLTQTFELHLLDPVFMTGWVLAAAMALQLVLRLKKHLPKLIPGGIPGWTERHVSIGLFAVLTFALHISFSLPDTALEWVLFTLFIAVAASGLIGLYLLNVIPLKLDNDGTAESVEETPAARARIAAAAVRLAINSVEQSGSRAIVDLYAERLHEFFDRPRHALAHLQGSRRPLKQLVFEIDAAECDDGASHHGSLEELKQLVRSKYALDGRHVHEMAFKGWLFVHLPATYALVVVTIFHVCAVYAFTLGGHDATAVSTVINGAR